MERGSYVICPPVIDASLGVYALPVAVEKPSFENHRRGYHRGGWVRTSVDTFFRITVVPFRGQTAYTLSGRSPPKNVTAVLKSVYP